MTEQAKPTPIKVKHPTNGDLHDPTFCYGYMLDLADRLDCDVREVPGKINEPLIQFRKWINQFLRTKSAPAKELREIAFKLAALAAGGEDETKGLD